MDVARKIHFPFQLRDQGKLDVLLTVFVILQVFVYFSEPHNQCVGQVAGDCRKKLYFHYGLPTKIFFSVLIWIWRQCRFFFNTDFIPIYNIFLEILLFKCNFIIIILQSRNLSRSLIRHFLSIQSSLKVHTTTGHFFFLLACLFAQKILSCYPISITKTNIQESILGGIYLFSTFISNILFRYESFY